MNPNVGSADKAIRFILGLGIIGAGIYYNSWLGLIGLIPIITASISWCPLYAPFGLSTKKQQTNL